MDDKPISDLPEWNANPQPIDPLEPIVPQTVEDAAREAASQTVDDMNAAFDDASKTLRDTGREIESAVKSEPLNWEPASTFSPASAPLAASKTNTMAIISLISGLASWVLIPVIGGIAGLITGFMARDEIKKRNGVESGDGLAVAGIVISALNILAAVLCVCGFFALILLGLAMPN